MRYLSYVLFLVGIGWEAKAQMPPSNDDCSNAVALTVNPDVNCGATMPGTLASATASTGAPASSCGTFDDDVWYSFVATAASHVVNIAHVSGNTSDYSLQVIDGSSGCGNTTSLLCSDPTSNVIVSGLTPNTTYYLRVASYDSAGGPTSSFNICVGTPPPPPPNDDCSNAVALTVNPDLNCGTTAPGTLFWATTSSGVPASNCGAFDDDVWYSFVATAASHVVDITHVSGSAFDYSLQVIDGSGGCGDTTSLLCSDPTNDVFVSGLTPNTTYYLRVASNTGIGGQTSSFNICVGTPPPPPPNDDCSNAVALTVNPDLNCGTTAPGTLASATASTGAPASNCGTFDDDVWYSFVATTTSHVIDIAHVSGSNSNYTLQVIDGSSGCGNTTSHLCSNPTSGVFVSGLTPNTTYYLRVASFSSAGGQTSSFNICVGTPPPPPPNDDCSNAVALTVNPDLNCGTTAPGTVASATASSGAPASNCGTFDDDVWYSFVATTTSHVIDIAHVSGSVNDYSLQVIDGSSGCGNTTSLLCSDPTSNVLVSGLTPNTTYYLRVATYSSIGGNTSSFNICVGTPPPPPPNDDCSNAVALTVNPDLNCGTTTPGTVASATASTGAPASNCGTFDDDVWYSFVATTTSHVIDIAHVSGSNVNYTMQVIDGSSGCGNTTAHLCSNPTSDVTVFGLTPNTTYYLRVATYTATGGQTSNFNICVGTQTPLAITLKEITAANAGKTNKITWHTLDEKQGDKFELQKSTNGDLFTGINLQSANGISSTYVYVDETPAKGTTYYRLKMININGETEYSKIVQATTVEDVDGAIMLVYPNPVINNNLNIEVTGKIAGDAIITLTDITGKTIKTITAPVSSKTTIDMSNMLSGIYFLKYTDPARSQTVKVTK